MSNALKAREALEAARAFANKTAGSTLGLAMSGDDHPNPDEVLMGLSSEGMELASKLSAALSALDLSAIGAEGWKPTHRHKKRGSEYMLLSAGRMQTENWIGDVMVDGDYTRRSVDMREVAIYRGADGEMWVRPREEFEDGRFEPLPSPPEPRS